MFGLEERHVAGNPKQNRLKAGDPPFLWRKVGLMSSGAASLEDGIKDTCSLEVKGGGVFYFKTNYIKKLTKTVYFYAIDDTKPSTYG